MQNTRRALAALFIPAFFAAATTLPVAAQDKKPAKPAEKPAEKGAVPPAGMSTTKNVGKSEITIYTVVLKPE